MSQVRDGALACAAVAAAFVSSGAVGHELGPRAATVSLLASLATQLESMRATTGSLPSSSEGVESAVTSMEPGVDAWGRPFVYIRVAGGFWLMSWGADGAPGGTGDAEDVVYISR